MRRLLLAAALVSAGPSALGQEKPPAPPAAESAPPTPGQAAGEALAAFRAKDDGKLRGIAARDDPDPWIVADELLARGEPGAAEAFAKAAPRKDVERLPEYVALHRGNPPDAKERGALAAASEALSGRKWKEALAAIEEAKPAGDDVVSIRLEHARGLALGGLRHHEESVTAFRKAADAAERLGWFARMVSSLFRGGLGATSRSDWRTGLELWERMRTAEECRGNRPGVAAALGNTGILLYNLGDFPGALDTQQRALLLLEELGGDGGIANTLGNIGNIHTSLGDYPRALDFQQRALKLKEKLGDRKGVAATLGNIGILYGCLGDHLKALETKRRALEICEEVGDQEGIAVTLGNIGADYLDLGDYAKALLTAEQALRLKEELGDRKGVALTLGNIGGIHNSLGDRPKALAFHERALKLKEELGDREGAALSLESIGSVHFNLEDYPKALDFKERALRLNEELGIRVGIARTLQGIGAIHSGLEDYPRALEIQGRALRLLEEVGDLAGIAASLGSMAAIHYDLRDYRRALEYRERAVAVAEKLQSRDSLVSNLGGCARARLALGQPREAAAAARKAVSEMPRLVQGLGEEQGATARGRFAAVFDAGARAALALRDPPEAGFFLEAGRAGALGESLRAREALWAFLVPEPLRREEAEARAAESVAIARLRRARKEGDAQAAATLEGDLGAARERLRDAIARIQREAKAAADVLYPRADSLDEIRGRLRPGEALVLYGLCLEESMALVVTPEGGRLVPLGRKKDIESACGALASALESREGDPSPLIEAIRKLALEPLGLEETVRRLLVSPDGALSYVPFALACGDREVVCVPSGTTYGLLREERAGKGEGVLALGDPDYGTRTGPMALAAMRGGLDLQRLPATGDEARAVGQKVLLGREATEAGLREALAKRPRWRAVHLACHGMVDPERPTLSALALTPTADDDGFLSVLDVFRMKVPADLVVLSACETGKGKVIRGEGIFGLTRAFMFAGAPRVIVSLWKVDDEATRALMVRFYELWNPKDGSKGLGAAAALKDAQAFVAAQPKWKHPRYWAAWVLWGLPD